MPERIVDPLYVGPLPERPNALVLMLHGGAERSHQPVDRRNLALRRAQAMFRILSPRLAKHGVGTGLLSFTVKGWNAADGPEPAPVTDARAALARLNTDFPELPIVLLGHSMGARTASRVVDSPGVIGMVGLAPWLPADDPVEALRGRHLVAVHGSRDKITSPRHTRRYVDRAREIAGSADFIDMSGLGHYMLRGADRWNRIALNATLGLVHDGCPDRGDVGGVTQGN